jgi:hypothetical protein
VLVGKLLKKAIVGGAAAWTVSKRAGTKTRDVAEVGPSKEQPYPEAGAFQFNKKEFTYMGHKR